MPAGVVLRCNAGAVAWQARVAPCSRVGSRPARRPCAVRAAEDKGYFSEAEPEKGLQPLWGQQTKRDLVKEKEEGELIWNVDWERQFDSAERDSRDDAQRSAAAGSPPQQRGFLSLSRSMALDDLSVELNSPVLKKAADTSAVTMTLAEGLAPLESAFVPAKGAPRYAPTRGDRRRWSGNSKFVTSSTAMEVDAAMEGEEERLAARKADLERYETLKAELVGFTLGIGGVTTVAVAALYSPEAAGSYAIGAAGGLLYLRLLSRSVDSTSGGANSVGDVVEGTIGGQRLLVPAILVAGWNRWNALAAPVTGVELQIAPILAGFFTYKVATLVQLFKDLLPSRSTDAGAQS